MRRVAIPLLAIPVVGGCTLGPDYAGPPQVDAPAQFQRAASIGQDEQPVVLQGRWWTQLGDPLLDDLVDKALAGNFDIDAAEARLAQARAMVKRRRAERLPDGEASATYQRTKPNFSYLGESLPGISPQDIDLYDLRYDASWEIDLFGGKRRRLEAALADAGALAAQLQDTRLRIATETVQAYIALRGAQQRLELNRQTVEIQMRLLNLVEARRSEGAASVFDVSRIEGTLYQSQAARPAIAAQADLARDRLAVLTGQNPGALDAQLSDVRALPDMPATIALGDPAEVLRLRPDVREAERRLAAANARIGSAMADQFPRISLFGFAGFSANAPSGLDDGFTYGVGPSLSWRWPDFGAKAAGVDIARNRFDEVLARYRGTVLEALRDAERAITRHAATVEEERLRLLASEASERAGELARIRYREGAGSLIEVLDAERERLQAADALNDVQTDKAASFVELQKSLGLGWQEPPRSP